MPDDTDKEIALIGEFMEKLRPFNAKTRSRILEYIISWHNQQCDQYLHNKRVKVIDEEDS